MKTQSPDTSFDDYKWNDDLPGSEYRIADLAERESRIRDQFLPAGIVYDSAEYWDHLRSMSKSQRLSEGLAMTDMLLNEVRAEIKAEHPHWSEQEQKVEFVARMYGPTLAEHFRRSLEVKGKQEWQF